MVVRVAIANHSALNAIAAIPTASSVDVVEKVVPHLPLWALELGP
ncbi:MAG: hypothetical protein ACLFTG_03840 [Alphaproteobacteria bacterium]